MHKFFHEKAWICSRQRHEKVNASICARPTTHQDLASVIRDEKKEKKKKRGRENETNALTGFFFFADLIF